jgi:hypothetical protein
MADGEKILELNDGQIRNLHFPNIDKIGDTFLYSNNELKSASLPKVRKIGDKFLYKNTSLKNLHAPKLEDIGRGFLSNNKSLKKLVEGILSGFAFNNIMRAGGGAAPLQRQNQGR